MNLQGQNILFISPEFFGIDQRIMQALRDLGANVIWFDERSVRSPFGRALNSVNPLFFYIQSNHYYSQKLNEIECKVNIVLIIKGEMITKKTIRQIRNKWPNVELILYLYDPIENIKGIKNKFTLYDRVISFEPKDCKKYGFEFRPLFSDFDLRIDYGEKIELKYDICFYGTMYGDRFDIVYKIKEFSKKNNLKFYSFCFLRGKFMTLFYVATNKGFRKLGIGDISFESKSSTELADIVRTSKIILDANDIKQQGLTIRTLETLLSGKKMITTNTDIKNYDFYNSNNICIIDRNCISIPEEFINSEYQPIDKQILEKYTAMGWIRDVFKQY